jgi:myo-inositol-1(or 4)-monophosphatase
VSKGKLIYGHIYDPYSDELFTALKGEGAYLNNTRIFCSKTSTLDTSMVATGSPPNLDSLNASLRASTLLSSQVRCMRVLGAACINTAWVANGRLTAYFEAGLYSRMYFHSLI